MDNDDSNAPQKNRDEHRSQVAITNDDLARERAQTKRENDRQDEQANRREKVTLWVAVAGVVIAAASTGISWFQWDLMRQQLSDARESSKTQDRVTARTLAALEKQADAMTNSIGPATTSAAGAAERSATSAAQMAGATKSASESAARTANVVAQQLERTDRPFLTVVASPGGPVIATAKGMEFEVQITVTNGGRSEATGVVVFSKMSFGGIGTFSKQLADACELADTLKNAEYWNRVSIKPPNGFTTVYNEALNAETIRQNQLPVADVTADYFFPVIIGCVAYSIPYSERAHHTTFAYDIFRRPRDPSVIPAFQLGVSVPLEEILIRENTLTKQRLD